MNKFIKIVVIGDIHGRDCWFDIVNQNKDADLFIFVGDYFDSFTIPSLEQISNFRSILKFKEENPGKVILLIGNHEFHYTSGGVGAMYDGFDYSTFYNMKLELDSLIKREELKICHKVDNILFSHAGVTNTWVENNSVDLSNIEHSINDFLVYRPRVFNFTSGDKYGDSITQGPLWVRENSLKEDGLSDYIHIVGHSHSEDIIFNINDNEVNYVIIDTLEHKKYLEITILDDNTKIFTQRELF